MDGVESFEARKSAYLHLLEQGVFFETSVMPYISQMIDASNGQVSADLAKAILLNLGTLQLRCALMSTSQIEASHIFHGEQVEEKNPRVFTNLSFALHEAEKDPVLFNFSIFKTHLIMTLAIFTMNMQPDDEIDSAWEKRLNHMNQLNLEDQDIHLVRMREQINLRVSSNSAKC